MKDSITYAGLEWQPEQLMGLLWMLLRDGWSVSFSRNVLDRVIRVEAHRCNVDIRASENAESTNDGDLVAAQWRALQRVVVQTPLTDKSPAEQIDWLVRRVLDLEAEAAAERKQ